MTTTNKRIDFKSNKWTFYFLEQEEIDFLADGKVSTHNESVVSDRKKIVVLKPN